MVRKCEICERTLRTGRKYCWEHRSSGYAGESKWIGKGYGSGGFGILIMIFLLFGLMVNVILRVGQWFKAHIWVFYSLVGIAVLLWILFVYMRFFKR